MELLTILLKDGVFENGHVYNETTLEEVRKRVEANL